MKMEYASLLLVTKDTMLRIKNVCLVIHNVCLVQLKHHAFLVTLVLLPQVQVVFVQILLFNDISKNVTTNVRFN